MRKIVFFLQAVLWASVFSQQRGVGKFEEVYAWKQLTFNIDGNILVRDRATAEGLLGQERVGRNTPYMHDPYYGGGDNTNWNQGYQDYGVPSYESSVNRRDASTQPNDESSTFYIQYNNLPMGALRVGNRLFVSIPRRRYGIPSTLNYLDLTRDVERSPSLRPYPSLLESQSLTSVYRTRADECGRLWMVDTGLLEIPDRPVQVQQPAIVVFDLRTDRQILRYQLKDSDVPANYTPTGLPSITIDTSNGCADTFAYLPDLATYGIIVYSVRENDSWRIEHHYMHYNPLAVNLYSAGQNFQWSDGIFSIVLGPSYGRGRCRRAFFHPLLSTNEFSVSTCDLMNRTASSDSDFWGRFSVVGERGLGSQSTMHDIHQPTGVIFYAEIGSDSVSCWNINNVLEPRNKAVLAHDNVLMSYPADIHVTEDEVWVIANTMPRFAYASLDTNEYNYFIYKGDVQNLITGTACESRPSSYYYN